MNRKTVSGIMLTLLLIGMLTLAFNIQPVKASGTIYIRADGSVEPDTAPISSVDNVTYTFTDNIYGSIVVERDNIVVDGADYALQGTGSGTGISLHTRSNVTIKNMEIKAFKFGITLSESSYNNISGNIVTENNLDGIVLVFSSNYNSVFGNNITNNREHGIELNKASNHNIISGNNITNNWRGVYSHHSSNNIIYHNNFVDNTEQVYSYGSPNAWDDSYPSGGNYWSDYEEEYPYAEELDGSGIWNTPYVIDEDNQDNYPLMEPWTHIDELKAEIEELGSKGEIDNQGIVKSLIAKLNVAQKLVDKGKLDEAKTILEEDFIPQVQNLSGIHITPKAEDILIKSAEYILSHL